MQHRFHSIFARLSILKSPLLVGMSLLLLVVSLVALTLPQIRATAATGVTKISFPGQHLWMQNGVSTSSYIFGTTDLAQETVTPNIESSAKIQSILKKSGITLIRTEFPDNASTAVIDLRLKTIANSGATCLGTILNPNNVAWDMQLVQQASDRCSLWEIGLSPDKNGVNAQAYLQEWKTLVPQLRKIHTNTPLTILGPGISTEDHAFLDTFLKGAKQANVLPDGISYHWFPCMQLAQNDCLAQATTVGQTVQDAQALSQQDLGNTLPIAITAWNAQFGANPSAYITDPNFIATFTNDALTAMLQSGVAIAAQVAAASGAGGGKLDMISTTPTLTANAQLIAMQVMISIDAANCATATPTLSPTNPMATATNTGDSYAPNAMANATPLAATATTVLCTPVPCPTTSGNSAPTTQICTPVPCPTTSGIPTPTTQICTSVPCPTASGTPSGTPTATTESQVDCTPTLTQSVGWTAFDGGTSRSGVNTTENTISSANVGNLTRHLQVKLPAIADSSPVELLQVKTTMGTKDLLYVTTLTGKLLAIDAQTGQIVWQASTTGPNITTSSPAIDPSRNYVYSYGLDGKIHKYESGTGNEVKTTVAGGGWPATITLLPQTEKESSALNIGGGVLYATTSGYNGDTPPYVGHVVAINLTTGKMSIFNALCANVTTLLQGTGNNSCAAQKAGIWARGGVVIDAPPPDGTGHIFITTGNGAYDANQGGHDYGDSVLALSPDLKLFDSYTPSTFAQLQTNDQDLGSSAPVLLPRQTGSATPLMLVQLSKDQTVRLLNREDLSGQKGPNHLSGELQQLPLAQHCDVVTQPAVWTDQNGTTWVFIATNCGFSAYTVHTDNAKKSTLVLAYQNSITGSSPLIAGGLMFVQGNGILHALDPMTGHEVWNSTNASAKGTIGTLHWQSPIVVNGQIDVLDNNGQLTTYTLPSP